MEILKQISIGCVFPLLFITSCEKSRSQGTCAATIHNSLTINYATECTLSGACTLTFPCTEGIQVQTPNSFLYSVKNIPTKLRLTQNLKATATAPFKINSMTTMTPTTQALLQTSPGSIDSTWFAANSPVECTIDDTALSITCVNFAPLADHFTMTGTIGDANVTLDVTVDSSGVTPAPTTTVAECGQFGVGTALTGHYTTAQRMYDCSKRVTDYAGIGSRGQASKPFVLGTSDPNKNWFLVGCPDSSNKELCSWLSPQIEYSNPVIGIRGTCPNCDNTSSDLQVGTRILWSGVLTNGTTDHDFGQVNGSNSFGEANCNGNDECAQYSRYRQYKGASPTYTFQEMITTNHRVTAVTANQTNLCTQQFNAGDTSFSGMFASIYDWQVPSYPVMLTISGFAGAECSSAPEGCIPEGFSAFSDPVPSFHTSLWSSSVIYDDLGWLFDCGPISFNFLDNRAGARCTSVAW